MDLDRKIYNTLIEYAHTVFPRLNMQVEGTFTTAQLHHNWVLDKDHKKVAIYHVPDELRDADPVTFSIDTFKMSFKPADVFRIAHHFEGLVGLKQAEKERFSNIDIGKVLIEFTMPKGASDIVNACANDELRPQMEGVYVDTETRCIVASDGHIMRVINIPDMKVAPEACGTIIHQKVVKNAKGTIKVSDSEASNGADTEKNIEGNYPNWKSIVGEWGDNQKVDLRGAWKDIQKAMSKMKRDRYYEEVVLSGVTGNQTMEIFAKDDCFSTSSKFVVPLSQPLKFNFKVRVSPENILKVKKANYLYLHSDTRAMIFATDNEFSLVMPMLLKNAEGLYTDKETWKIEPINPRSAFDICNFTTGMAKPSAPAVAELPQPHPTPYPLRFSHLLYCVWDFTEVKSQAA